MDLSIVLLHECMFDKQGDEVTTSLTLIDVHDIARSARTYGVKRVFVAHPSIALRTLAETLQEHWQTGYGASYNPDRKDALSLVRIVSTLDYAISQISSETGRNPILIGTSARAGNSRISVSELRAELEGDQIPRLILFGTGSGMTDSLLKRTDAILEPITGPTDYNHLSVRSACAIVLDRLLAPALR